MVKPAAQLPQQKGEPIGRRIRGGGKGGGQFGKDGAADLYPAGVVKGLPMGVCQRQRLLRRHGQAMAGRGFPDRRQAGGFFVLSGSQQGEKGIFHGDFLLFKIRG